MAATIGLVEAVTVLQEHFGSRLEASHDEGQHLLAEALQKHFAISGRAARKLVEELEQARTIRWRSGPRSTASDASGGFGAGMAPSGSSPGGGGYAGQNLLPLNEGSYWQLGSPS